VALPSPPPSRRTATKDVRFLSPDVALIHAVGGTVMRGKSEPSPDRDSIQTLVAVRQEGDLWRLAAFQNTRIRPMGRNASSFLIWALSDMLWKVLGPKQEAATSNPSSERKTP
jgi:hypothetical protein